MSDVEENGILDGCFLTWVAITEKGKKGKETKS